MLCSFFNGRLWVNNSQERHIGVHRFCPRGLLNVFMFAVEAVTCEFSWQTEASQPSKQPSKTSDVNLISLCWLVWPLSPFLMWRFSTGTSNRSLVQPLTPTPAAFVFVEFNSPKAAERGHLFLHFCAIHAPKNRAINQVCRERTNSRMMVTSLLLVAMRS